MSHTTDKMREVAGTIARLITEQGKNLGVDICSVDDFGKYGNFSLICYLKMERSHSTIQGRAYKHIDKDFKMIKVTNLIKKVCAEYKDKGARLRASESPTRMYSSNSCGGMRFKADFVGYDKTYIQIDLDFIPYHEESNTFAVQTPFVDDAQLELNL